VTDSLPVYRVKARNVSSSGENAIHDDETARRYGFRGALVPGVMVYAYMTQPLAAVFGGAWLSRGTASVRFVKPVLDGEELVVRGAVTSRDAAGVTATLTALSNGQADDLLISAAPGEIKYDEGKVKEVLAAYSAGEGEPGIDVSEPRIVADELVKRAQASAAAVTFIEDASLLAEVGGVGATLRYRI